jgi:hypothetical protein
MYVYTVAVGHRSVKIWTNVSMIKHFILLPDRQNVLSHCQATLSSTKAGVQRLVYSAELLLLSSIIASTSIIIMIMVKLKKLYKSDYSLEWMRLKFNG